MNRRILRCGKARSVAEVDKHLYLDVSFCCSCNSLNLSITEFGNLFSSKRYTAVNTCPVLFIYLHIMFVNFIYLNSKQKYVPSAFNYKLLSILSIHAVPWCRNNSIENKVRG